mgnify:CR=1 FL=1
MDERAAVVEHVDDLADLHDERHVVLDQDDGGAVLVPLNSTMIAVALPEIGAMKRAGTKNPVVRASRRRSPAASPSAATPSKPSPTESSMPSLNR